MAERWLWAMMVGVSLATVFTERPAVAADLYVAPHGRATLCTQHEPCSLQQAKLKVQRLSTASEQEVVVHLSRGRYRLAAPLNFGVQDSGQPNRAVRWVGDEKGGTVLDGSQTVHGWKRVDAPRNVWRAALPADRMALQLYVDGVEAVPARHTGCVSKKECTYTKDGLIGGADLLGTLAHPEDVVAVLGVRWRDFHCNVQSIHGKDIVMAEPCWHNTVVDSVKNGWSNASPKGKPFAGIDWFEGAYEFLGTPGQFYIDPREHWIYYVPRTGEEMASAKVEIPVTEHLLQINGTPQHHVHDLSFEHITFARAGWVPDAANGYVPLQAGYLVTGERKDLPHNGEGLLRIPASVEITGGERIQFAEDTFEQLGLAGIGLAGGTRDSVITHNTFHDLAGGAIFVGDIVAAPKHAEDRSAGNKVSRNTITHVADRYRDNVGIMGAFNDGLLIDHNTLSDLPYTAISVGWGWNYEGEGDVQRDIHIRSNAISDFMQTLRDGGAIYTQAQSPGSDVLENYVRFSKGNDGNGIYLDERSRKYLVCGNVIQELPAKMQEGRWLSAWASWSGFLDIHDNWSNDERVKLHDPGPTKKYYDNHLALQAFPAEAQSVMHAAGVAGGDALVTGCLKP